LINDFEKKEIDNGLNEIKNHDEYKYDIESNSLLYELKIFDIKAIFGSHEEVDNLTDIKSNFSIQIA
jgi:hypothetical protein